MRRLLAVFAFVATAAGVAWGGDYSYPRDAQWGPDLPSGGPVLSYWRHASSGSWLDASRWSLPYPPNSIYGQRLELIVREVGAPYEITATTLHAWHLRTLTSGVTITASSGARIKGDLDLQRGTLHLVASAYTKQIQARRLHIGGSLIIDGACDIHNYYQYDQPPDEFIVTGELRFRAVPMNYGWWSTSEIRGAVQNFGRLTLTGAAPDQTVHVSAGGVENYGQILLEAGVGPGGRMLSGVSLNAGDILATSENASIFATGETFVNTGAVRVAAGAQLAIAGQTFRHEAGIIESDGTLLLNAERFEWAGGEIGPGVYLVGMECELIGEGQQGALRPRGAGALHGDIGEGVSLELSEAMANGAAMAADTIWTGGLNRGVIRVHGSGLNRLTISGDMVNHGVIEARDSSFNRIEPAGMVHNHGLIHLDRGWLLGEVVNLGEVRLGLYSLIGHGSRQNLFDGLVVIEPFARAQVNGVSTLRGTLRVQPTAAAFLPNYQHQVFFNAALTIDGATLDIQPGPGFAPAWGRVYNLVGSGPVTGDFAAATAAPLPDPLWRWEIERHGNSYRGRIAHAADVNRDLGIDFADINAVVAAWGSTAGGGADVDGDGVVGFGDLAIVAAHFGQYAN